MEGRKERRPKKEDEEGLPSSSPFLRVSLERTLHAWKYVLIQNLQLCQSASVVSSNTLYGHAWKNVSFSGTRWNQAVRLHFHRADVMCRWGKLIQPHWDALFLFFIPIDVTQTSQKSLKYRLKWFLKVCCFYLRKRKSLFLWTLGSKSTFPTWLQVICATHRIDRRVGVNLQSVDVITGVLEQAVVRVQHLMWQQIEPLPARGYNEHGRRE